MVSLSVLAIAKNENDYIKEFVDFYLLNGVDHFYLYDNDSDVPLSETLCDYLNVCTIHKISGVRKQFAAYNHFLSHHKNETEWVAVFDIDEFVYTKKHETFRDFVLDIGKGVDCIGLNWVIFGNGKHTLKPEKGGIVDNYVYSQGVQHKNVKCITRTSAIKKFDHPHYPRLKWFKKYVNAKGNKMSGDLNEEYCIDVAQLNHYYTKSLEEFREKLFNKRRADNGEVRAEVASNMQWMPTEPERCSVFFDDGLLMKRTTLQNQQN